MLRSLLLQLCFGAITVIVRRAAGRRYYRGKCGPDDLTHLYGYALDGFAYAVEAHFRVRLTARVTVASYWTSGERRVVGQELLALLFSTVAARRADILSRY